MKPIPSLYEGPATVLDRDSQHLSTGTASFDTSGLSETYGPSAPFPGTLDSPRAFALLLPGVHGQPYRLAYWGGRCEATASVAQEHYHFQIQE